MIRCLTISFALHIGSILALVVLSLMTPPLRRVLPPTIQIGIYTAPPPGLAGAASQAASTRPASTPAARSTPAVRATVAPTAAPTPVATATPQIIVQPTPAASPKATPKVTPRPTPRKPEDKKPPEPVKTVVEKHADLVKPTPRATPVELAKADATPRPGPTATPGATPAATPAGPPPAVDTSALPTGTPPKGNPGPRVTVGGSALETGSGGVFDTMGQTYFMTVLRKLEDNFKPPITPPGVTCRVRFTIMKDGTIANPRIDRSSGNGSIDQYAIQAVQKTDRVPPLYDGIRESYIDVIVTFSFDRQN